ncbi:FG-GAP-like repeat-containing protein [Dactylosporangium salmoneum]|uniref:VCBS repeat-containing protein n=1 Tax=Dactylosporangium salmoneum TaxID=53361 RepID=A0ABN3G7Y0_9ACTN
MSRSDLVVRNYYTGELLHFRHQGALDGPKTYAEALLISDRFGPRSVEWLGIGDFTGGGGTDLVAVTPAGRCVLYPGTPGPGGGLVLDGPLDLGCDLSRGAYHSLAVADVDGDGRVGIVARRAGSPVVDVLRTEIVAGRPRLRAPEVLAEVARTDYLIGMADVTGDGRLDLVVSRANGQLAAFELGLAGDPPRWHPVIQVAAGHRIVAIADVSGDGRPDMLAVRADGTLVAYPHAGGFRPGHPLATFLSPVPLGAGWGEFDIIN